MCLSDYLFRKTISKVYPAMFVDSVTELAFDDITPEDPDFSFIQGQSRIFEVCVLILQLVSMYDFLLAYHVYRIWILQAWQKLDLLKAGFQDVVIDRCLQTKTMAHFTSPLKGMH